MTYKARLKYIIPLTAITLWVVWVLYEFDDLRVKMLFVTLPSLAAIKISEKFCASTTMKRRGRQDLTATQNSGYVQDRSKGTPRCGKQRGPNLASTDVLRGRHKRRPVAIEGCRLRG